MAPYSSIRETFDTIDKMVLNILVVDDEKNIREGLSAALMMENYRVLQASDGQEALDIIHVEPIDLVITDLRMPRLSGGVLLERINARYPTIPVIILTGHGSIQVAVESMRKGAFDFITKPVNLDRMLLLAKRALSTRELVIQNRMLQEELARHHYSNIIGKSAAMQKVLAIVKQVAATKASVLITGESGVGKEIVADALHQLSGRKDKPFIKVHCAALSESLLESELFGHEKGAFTGALNRKRGRFELADGGSIFLDEIGEIDQNLQVKLLRVLQERIFERVGGESSVEVDVRIVSATNRDLKKEMEIGNFREDLFYRLNVLNIHIPPLRERKDDLPLLVSSFIKDIAKENDKEIEGIDSKANAALYAYSWPGNIRELRNCIESAVIMCKGQVIMLSDLPPIFQQENQENYINIPIGLTLAMAEREIIRNTLHANKGNKSKTATILDIGRKTLHRKIIENNIEAEESS